MIHTHSEKFTWIEYKPHKRPPRVCVKCSFCGECFQAVPQNGKIIEVFKTNRKRSELKQRNYKLTDEEDKIVKALIAFWHKGILSNWLKGIIEKWK